MQIEVFRSLAYEDQVAVLYHEGIYIGKKRTLLGGVVLLYQLESFYVKLYYRKYRRIIERITVFTSALHITEFLEHINIGELNLCS